MGEPRPDGLENDPVISTYLMPALVMKFTFGLFLIVPIVAVFLIVLDAVSDSGLPVALVVAWIGGAIWVAYAFLVRPAIRLELSSSTLYWQAPIRSGSIALADLESVRRHRLDRRMYAIRAKGHRRVFVSMQLGLPDFLRDVQELAPWMTVRLSWEHRRRDPTGFRGDYWGFRANYRRRSRSGP